jgi:hypothetical protein
MEAINTKTLLRTALLSGILCYADITQAQNVITNDSYFYGQSPPVYPSRELPATLPTIFLDNMTDVFRS